MVKDHLPRTMSKVLNWIGENMANVLEVTPTTIWNHRIGKTWVCRKWPPTAFWNHRITLSPPCHCITPLAAWDHFFAEDNVSLGLIYFLPHHSFPWKFVRSSSLLYLLFSPSFIDSQMMIYFYDEGHHDDGSETCQGSLPAARFYAVRMSRALWLWDYKMGIQWIQTLNRGSLAFYDSFIRLIL